jgi:hypothetical protein
MGMITETLPKWRPVKLLPLNQRPLMALRQG